MKHTAPHTQNPGSLWASKDGLAGEDAVLALIDALFPSRCPHVPFGRGHDCAELAALPHNLALSTDMFIEDVHFRRAYYTPEEVGGKALASAVSDLAAAGARPLGFSLGLALPHDAGVEALSGILSGMAAKAKEYGIVLSGGDLSRAGGYVFSLTVWGEPVAKGAGFLRRDRPQPGDMLFVTGPCGLAKAGLWALEADGRAACAQYPEACAAFLSPRPMLAEGQALARLAAECAEGSEPGRICLMDMSDGLVRDLPRLLGGEKSALGAELTFDAGCVHPEVRALSERAGFSAEEFACLGGEEYALLGACSADIFPRVRGCVPGLLALGQVTKERGIRLQGRAVGFSGFDHFAGGDQAAETGRSAKNGQAACNLARPEREFAEKALTETGRSAWQAGLMAGFNGNISCRTTLENGQPACLITRSGAAKARLGAGDFSLLSLPGGELLHGPAASTESAVHTGIYMACPESLAILHTHPPRLLALSLLREPAQRLDLPLPEAKTYAAKIAWVPFFPPGSAELGAAVAKAARSFPAVWMERHGLVVHGPDANFVLSLSEELEQLASVCLALVEKEAPAP